MSAREASTLSYWRASRLALQGDLLAGRRLMVIAAYKSFDVSRIADAAANSLNIAAMRIGR